MVSLKRICVFLIILVSGCNQPVEKVRGIPSGSGIEVEAPNIEVRTEALQEEGYQIFKYEREDSTYIMQQYYIVFLKEGANRSQDSALSAQLQQEHLDFLTRMYDEGYTSLTGPMGNDGKIKGIVVYNTPTIAMADSLARLDPMVKSGRLEVEVLPWWTAKGGRLR